MEFLTKITSTTFRCADNSELASYLARVGWEAGKASIGELARLTKDNCTIALSAVGGVRISGSNLDVAHEALAGIARVGVQRG